MGGLLGKLSLYLKRHSPTILTCVGALGVIGTAVLAVKATPKAVRMIEAAEVEKSIRLGQGSESTTGKLTKKEVIQVAWKCYIPAAATGLGTIFCILSAHMLNQKRQSSIMSAYLLVDSAYKEYRSKVKELYGEEADDRVEKAIMEERYQKFREEHMETNPAYGETQLFYEENHRQFFHSTKEQVLNAEHHINEILNITGHATLQEFHIMLGLDSPDQGLGWNLDYVDDGFYGGSSWIDFSHEDIVLEDGLECTIITIETSLKMIY